MDCLETVPGATATRIPAAKLHPVPRFASIGLAALLSAGALVGCGKGDSQATPEAFCTHLATELPVLAGNSADPAEAQKMVDAFDRVQPYTPSVIAKNWKTLRGLFAKIADSDPTKDSAFGDAFAALLASDARNAANNVTGYVKDTCNIDMNAATGTAGATTTAPTEAAATTAIKAAATTAKK